MYTACQPHAHILSCKHACCDTTLACKNRLHTIRYMSGTPCYDRLVAEFGQGIVGPDGEVDRRALGPIVFADPTRLETLNTIVWPEIRRMVEQHLAQSQSRICVVEAAVLLRAGWDTVVDEVWLVAAQRKVALARLMARNQIDEAAAQQKINAQEHTLGTAQAYSRSHVLVANDGSMEAVRGVVSKAFGLLRDRHGRTLSDLAAVGGEASLPARWLSLCESCGVSTEGQSAWWRVIRDAYGHRSRHFTTLALLEQQFTAFDVCRDKLTSPLAVSLAIFFHGAVLDPTASAERNGQQGASLCHRFLSEATGAAAEPGEVRSSCESAADWIEQSSRGEVRTGGGITDGDNAYFHDILHSHLARDASQYRAAALAAHLEQHHLSDAEWRATRPVLLEKQYLETTNIFYTACFADLESTARHNVTAEVQQLRAMRGATVRASY